MVGIEGGSSPHAKDDSSTTTTRRGSTSRYSLLPRVAALRAVWDFQEELEGRVRIAELNDPVELAVSPYPALTRPATEPHGCALQRDGSVYCFSIDVPDAGGHLVRGLP